MAFLQSRFGHKRLVNALKITQCSGKPSTLFKELQDLSQAIEFGWAMTTSPLYSFQHLYAPLSSQKLARALTAQDAHHWQPMHAAEYSMGLKAFVSAAFVFDSAAPTGKYWAGNNARHCACTS